jgi:TPP-dependent pyruvate/acetoin dehydrogenase alpha subunit
MQINKSARSSNSSVPFIKLYEQMLLIRRFEEYALGLFSEGLLSGTTHTYVGQEAGAVSVINHLRDDDLILSNHRCHGHYLTRFDDPVGLLAEMMGRVGGVCGGRGGSQHLYRSGFYSNGVQGGMMPVATGMAWTEKHRGSGAIVVAFIGDGTLGEGTVYESLNMASLWQLPLLVVCENNRYAQSTSIVANLAGDIVTRARAFGISAGEIESNDVAELYPRFAECIDEVRETTRPHMEVIHTYRINAHSKGDDFRPGEEIAYWAKRDPLCYAARHLDTATVAAIKARVASRVQEAGHLALEMPESRLRSSQLSMFVGRTV